MKVQRLSRNGVHIKQCGSGEPIRNDSDDIVQAAWKHAEVLRELAKELRLLLNNSPKRSSNDW